MFKLWQQGALNLGEILILNYKRLGLDEPTFAFLLLLARHLRENPSGWSLSEIAELMTIDLHTCSQIFMRLVEDGFLLVDQQVGENDERWVNYSLTPLFVKLETIIKTDSNIERTADLEALASKIEQLFGVLSPRDIELVQMWMNDDGFAPAIIELALAEMQMHDIRSLKYVDKILLDWKRKNIFTVDEARRSLIEFRNRATGKKDFSTDTNGNPEDYYNWIDKIKQELK